MKYSLTGRLLLARALKVPVYLLGRQPILTDQGNVFGYELLYRPSSENFAEVIENDQATLSVILNSFFQAGLRNIVGTKKAFVHITSSFLVGHFPIPIPQDRSILQISASVLFNKDMVRPVKELSDLGYGIAADSLLNIEQARKLDNLASQVKIDVTAFEPDELSSIVRILKDQGKTLVAEQVNSYEDYYRCVNLGFDLFQGVYFCKPQAAHLISSSPSNGVILKALATLNDPEMEAGQLESILSMDSSLAYQLLKLVNSGTNTLSVEVTTLNNAINMVGLQQVKIWLSLLLMSKIPNKPAELSAEGLFRSYMARTLAHEMRIPNIDFFAQAGIFSVFEALFDVPIRQVIDGMKLSADVVDGLVERKGYVGEVLQAVEAVELGKYANLLQLGFRPQVINQVMIDALRWTETYKEMLAAGEIAADKKL